MNIQVSASENAFLCTASIALCVNAIKGWRATSQVGKLHLSSFMMGMVHKIKRLYLNLWKSNVKKLKILCIMIIVTGLKIFQINQTMLCFSAFI